MQQNEFSGGAPPGQAEEDYTVQRFPRSASWKWEDKTRMKEWDAKGESGR